MYWVVRANGTVEGQEMLDFHTALRKAHIEFESRICAVEKKYESVYAFGKQQNFCILSVIS